MRALVLIVVVAFSGVPAQTVVAQPLEVADVVASCSAWTDERYRTSPTREVEVGRCLGGISTMREDQEWNRAAGEPVRYCLPEKDEDVVVRLIAFHERQPFPTRLSWGRFMREDARKVFACGKGTGGVILGPTR